MPAEPPIFDGHNDVLSRLLEAERTAALGGPITDPATQPPSFFERNDDRGHIDLPRAQAGGFGGGLFSVYIGPDPQAWAAAGAVLGQSLDGNPVRFPRSLTQDFAQRNALAEMGLLFRLQRLSCGQLRIVRDAADLRQCLATGILAAVIHFEGAEPIDPSLDTLELFYAAGLRSVGPVWSRQNDFGEGVPYLFPHSPDTGPGLTDAGKALVAACNKLGIVVDLSHINERGFWDIANATDKPLVASHSNAHALAPSPRNLTDRQLDAIKESNGVVGVNFYTGFLRADGRRDASTPIASIVDHFRYLVDRMGIDHVGFGADLDGALIPSEVGDVAGLPKVMVALRAAGFDEPALKKLANENWLRVLDATWQPAR
ncbi:MAG TPA: dipeptidase [Chloroflexota bacterium]|jgi:membrane dipeptidase|nr:dipeptidase [Chloroflexota bacterium]